MGPTSWHICFFSQKERVMARRKRERELGNESKKREGGELKVKKKRDLRRERERVEERKTVKKRV